jgi:antitoxin YefM
MRTITLQQAQENLPSLMEDAIMHREPLLIRSGAGREIVCLPLEDFVSWQETLYLLSNRANADHLRRSIAESRTSNS